MHITFCGIETIELPLRSSHKKSVFEPRPAPSHQHYGKAFIMRLPWQNSESSVLNYFAFLNLLSILNLKKL
ncbi:MAG: hypothetical protein SOT46_10570 [Treponema sp.]|nr:hypothetical protein [Spirochaetia bacterium]MDY2840798.1 hypothetical protein [Treponema sp.]